MKLLFLTDNFPPEVNAPASRTFEHCRLWASKGHEITVITGFPNFPAGKVFPGYRNGLWSIEMLEGIRVVRVWTFITRNEGIVLRTLDYLSFMLTGFVAALLHRGADAVIGTSPQFFTVVAAWAAAALKRVPFVFELRDLWPESIVAVGALRGSVLIRTLEAVELGLYRRARLIVSVTRAFKENLIRRGVPVEKITVVTNGVDLQRFRPGPPPAELIERLNPAGKFVVGYIGTHGLAHGLETVLQAARLAERDGDGFLFLFLGSGAQKRAIVELSAEMGLGNAVFLDPVPKEQVVGFWNLLDATLIPLKRAELFKTVIPSKIFESMAMGVPIVLGVEGEAKDLVEESGSGLTVPPEDPAALYLAVKSLRDSRPLREDISRKSRESSTRFDRRVLAAAMLDEIERACVKGRGEM